MPSKKEPAYYYAEKGETKGPFEFSQMKELFDTEAIFSETNVWCKGMSEWLPLNQSPIRDRILEAIPDRPQSAAKPPPPPPPKPTPPKENKPAPISTARRKSERRTSFSAAETDKLSPINDKNRVTSIDELRRASRRLSRRNPSQCFMEEFEGGTLLWVEDPILVWKLCQVIRQNNFILEVEVVEERRMETVDTNFQETHRHNPHVMPDMTSLHYLHEASILYNLGVRSAERLPYTYMGSVLIAVNPLQQIPLPDMSTYEDATSKQTMPPHPYAIAATCVQQLNSSQAQNQSVVISGESGAGKTETAKIILNYLVKRAAQGGAASNNNLDSRLLQSSSILESFGNAVTSKNSNSSRFGKFMKIFFSPAEKRGGVGKLLGAAIETYLLEKSRVASQYSSERNYHVFYQLVSACRASAEAATKPDWAALIPDEVGAALCVGASEFAILSEPDTEHVRDDLAKFKCLTNSLATLDIDMNMVSEFWSILCGLLMLGNVTFGEKDAAGGVESFVLATDMCAAAAYFFGISAEELEQVLTERTMMTRGEVFTIHLNRVDAGFARDAICKQIYEGLFGLLVRTINEGLSSEDIVDSPYSVMRYIGVLDVFGFESFENNDFEQLLINFANESLQDTFNIQVFQAEMRLFEQENIHCSVSSHPDNRDCVELIAGKPNGIFAHLDSICKLPKPTDEKFCEELHSALSKHRFFPQTHPKDRKNTFWIKHYAGNVKYTVWDSVLNDETKGQGENNQWVMKNNDSIPEGIIPLMRASTYTCAQMLFPDAANPRKLTKGESFANYKWGGDFNGKKDDDKKMCAASKSGKMTIASAFVQSMSGLNSALLNTQCSFIRCIKPNAGMKLGVYDNSFVVGQIRSLGLVQACEILRIGLPHRISYVDLKGAVSYILQEAIEIFKGEPEEVFIASLFYGFEVPAEAYRLGRTRAFFRTGQLAALEGMLSDGAELRRDEVIARLHEALDIRREARLLADTCISRIKAAEKKFDHAKKSYDLLDNAAQEPAGSGKSLSSAHMTSADYQFSVYKRLVEDVKKVFQAIHRGGGSAMGVDANEIEAVNIATIDGNPKINEELLNLSRTCCNAIDVAQSTYAVVAARMDEMHKSDKAAKENTELHTIVAELWDHLIRLEGLMESAKTKCREAEDGALRCQIEYTMNRADICSSMLTSIDVITTEMDKLTSRAHSIVAGDYGGHRKTQVLADEIVEICIKESSQAQKVFDMCKELLQAKELAVTEYEEEVRNSPVVATRTMSSEEKPAAVASNAAGNFKARGKYAALSAIRKKMATHVKPAAAIEVAQVVEEAGETVELESEPELPELPDGWAEYRDEQRDLPYYFNMYTHATQWERPTEAALPVEDKDEDSVQIHGSDEHSYLQSEDGMSMRSEEDDIRVLDDVYVLPKPEGDATRAGFMRMSSRITADEFERVGMATKTGILMKRSKYLRLWKKRYVVLEDSKLMYYKKSQDYNSGIRQSDKTMTLTAESMTSFTTVKNVFSIKQRDPLSTGVGDTSGKKVRNGSKTSKSEQWFLMSKDDYEMHDWVTAISAHIHVVHMLAANYHKSREDYLRMGTAETTFWAVPAGKPGSQKLPIGIRTIPEFSGPRTGEGLYPGEVFEVVHRFNVYDEEYDDDEDLGTDGVESKGRVPINSFLKLADDRGWVFERHPKTRGHLFSPAAGEYKVQEFHCTYKEDQTADLYILFGPSFNCRSTGGMIHPGEDISICATFVLRGLSSGIAFVGGGCIEFLKLKDGRGWIPNTTEHGIELFEKSITRQNPLFAMRGGR